MFVVGGGPAGLATAIAARQKGMNVTVADGAAPPIDKTCGEGMMPETQAALRDLGVRLGCSDGFRFGGIRFVDEFSNASAKFPGGQGFGLARPLLHEKLITRAEECGVRLLWKAPVMGVHSGRVIVRGREIPARWIVGADGIASRVRRWARLDSARSSTLRFANRRHYAVTPWSEFMEIHFGHRAQAYVTPIASDEVSVVIVGARSKDAEFPEALESLPELRERLSGARVRGSERGAVTSSRSLHNVQRGNIALLGDASGSVDAITGEGLRLAFRQAFSLVSAIETGSLENYQRDHRILEKRPLLMAKLMVTLGSHRVLRSRVIQSFARKPELFARLLAFHVGEGTAADLLSTGAALGWQMLAA